MKIDLNRIKKESWTLYKGKTKIGVVDNFLQYLDICCQIKKNKETGYSIKLENKSHNISSNGRIEEDTCEYKPFDIVDDLFKKL